MKKNYLFIIIFFNSAIFSQNLVPNSSFEEIEDTIGGFINTAMEFESKIKDWKVPNTATTDLITPDFEEGFFKQIPPAHSGSNVVGIQCAKNKPKERYWSECIGVQLSKALNPNKIYHVTYWIRRAPCKAPSKGNDEFLIENFGILFTSDAINTTNPDMLLGTPQVGGDPQLFITSKKWVKVSKYFSPKEKYRFLYLGHFRKVGDKNPPFMKSYYIIDDVSVVEVKGFETLDKTATLQIGSTIHLNNVNFKTGTTELSDKTSYIILKKLVSYLNLNSSIRIKIKGHTDSIGNEKYNQLLSEKRAMTIAKILVKGGIDKDRIEWKGYGESNPVADNSTSEGRSKNRRVEFEVIK